MDCDLLIDTSCCDGWDDFTPADQERGTLMAWETLRYLSGFRLGNCPVTLRPCRDGCGRWPTYQAYPASGRSNWAGAEGGMTPTIVDGQWFNLVCGCGVGNCSCTQVCEVRLIGEVASIDEVKQDGVTIDPEAYRVDNGNLLVRTDGDCWPLCQDMTKPLTADGTFGVTYTPGVKSDAWVQSAAGALACEYAKVCSGQGGKCRLPANVTRIVRQGVSLDLAQNPFPSGMTGLREVDVLIARYNPSHLPSPSVVYSPDVRHGRVTTWQSP